jgi:hypothetical protein
MSHEQIQTVIYRVSRVVILAAMPASLNAIDAGSRGTLAQDVDAIKHAPQPVPVRNTDHF